MFAEIFEIAMIVCFGISWPFNVLRSYKSRTAKGKSLVFLICIITGYIAGITSKFFNEAYMDAFASKWYVLVFYFINLVMVLADLALYVRNVRLDKERANQLTA